MNTWDDLDYWSCGEWQVIEERLDDLDRGGTLYNPQRQDLFASLDAVPYPAVRVVFVGQDPYPDRKFATGVAYSIPKAYRKFPQTLLMIFKEYMRDLGYPCPKNGCLLPWCKQGVLLINAIPSCLTFQPGSHLSWFEWEFLTKEIIEKLDTRGGTPVLFVLMGGVARSFVKYIKNSPVFEVSHPSPRGCMASNVPFLGSSIFTKVNLKLQELGELPINWRL